MNINQRITLEEKQRVDKFTSQLEQLDGFGKNLRVTTYTENGKTRRVVR